MTEREQLFYLLEQYYNGKYDTSTFADEFSRIYDLETDYSTFSEIEDKLMQELSMVTGRFSSSEKDLQIPNAYFNERDVRDKATEIYKKLI